MKDSVKMIATLLVICVGAGLLLAWVYGATEQRIIETEAAVKAKAIKGVLPECTNDPLSTTNSIEANGEHWTFYVATKNEQPVGAAFETSTDKGYGGRIRIMVGVKADNTVQSIQILEQKETPGLGANIESPELFLDQFIDKPLSAIWKVKKDQGDIDAITAATISSRAVAEAVGAGIAVYQANQEIIMATAKEVQ